MTVHEVAAIITVCLTGLGFVVVAVSLVSGLKASLKSLGDKMESFSRSVDRLSETVDRLDNRVDNHDVRLSVLEDRRRQTG